MNTNTHLFSTDSTADESSVDYLKRLASSLMLSTLVMQSIFSVPIAAAQTASGSTAEASSSSISSSTENVISSSSSSDASQAESAVSSGETSSSSEISAAVSSMSSESSVTSSAASSLSSETHLSISSRAASDSSESSQVNVSSNASSIEMSSSSNVSSIVSSASSASSEIAVTLTGNTLLSVPENTHPTFEVGKAAEIQSGDELEARLMVVVTDPTGAQKEVAAKVTEEQGSYLVTLEPPANFVPGKYHVEAKLDETRGVGRRLQRFFRIAFTGDSGDTVLFEQDFVWGVIAFNPDRSVYLPGEYGSFSLAVLDDRGRTLCNADITMTVAKPDGSTQIFTTDNDTIYTNPDCKDKDVTYTPDYSFQMLFDQTGVYGFSMAAQTANGVRTLTQEIEAQETRLIDVKRYSATRIYPIADYEMRIKATPSRTFIGNISERVPAALRIVSVDPQPKSITTNEATGEKTITWGEKLWEAGEAYSFSYTYDAPDISPEFYLVGPLSAAGYLKNVTEETVDTVDTSSVGSESPMDVSASGTVLPTETESGSAVSLDGVSATGSVIPTEGETSSVSSEASSTGTGSASALSSEVSTGSALSSSSSVNSVSSASTSSVSSSTSTGTIQSSSSVSPASAASSTFSTSEAMSSSAGTDDPLSEVSATGSVSWIGSALSYLVPGARAQVNDSLDFEEPRRWQIASDAVGLSITGKVFQSDRSTGIGANKTVAVSLNGGIAAGTDDTDAGGQYTITNLTITGGTIVTLYIDGETEKGLAVTLGSGSNMTGMDIYTSHAIARSDSGSIALTTGHFGVSDNNADTDITSIFSVNAGVLNIKPSYALYVWANDQFTPGGAVNIGSGAIVQGTLTMAANALTLSGSLSNNGTLTSSHLVEFDGTSAGLRTIDMTAGTLSGITITGGNSNTYRLASSLILSGSLVLNSGTFSFDAATRNITTEHAFTADNSTLLLGTGTWSIGGNWDSKDVTTQTPGTSSVVLTGSGKSVINNIQTSLAGGVDFYDLSINGYYTVRAATDGSDETDQRISVQRQLVIGTNASVTLGATQLDEDIGFELPGNASDLQVRQGAFIRDTTGDSVVGSFFFGSGASISQMSGSIVNTVQNMIFGEHDAAGNRFIAADYNAAAWTFLDTGGSNGIFEFSAGTTTLGTIIYISLNTASSTTVDNRATNANIVIKNDVNFHNTYPQLATNKSLRWLKGNGTFTVSNSNIVAQALNFSGRTIEDIIINSPGNTVLLFGTGSTDSLTVTAGTFDQDRRNFDINGDLTINGGTYDMRGNGKTLTLSGSLINKSQFLAGTGTVSLDGFGQTLSGSTTFYNLSKTVTAAQTLTLTAGKTQTVSGAVTLRGAAGNRLSLRSNVAGAQANLKLVSGSTQTIDRLDVKDINSSGGTSPSCLVTTENCVNSGNNTNWTMGVTITGKVFNDGGSTSMGANKTVALSLNGAATSDVADTDAGGMFTVSGSTITGGTIVTLFLDGETEKGVLVTLGSGSTMTGVNIYRDHLIARSDSGSVALSTANLSVADNSADADISSIYSVDSNVLNVKSNKKLHVWSGDIFTPGTPVNIGSGITIAGTFNMAANAVTLSGAWITTGSFSGSNTVTFDGTGLGPRNIASNGSDFYNLTISAGVSATYRPSDTLALSGSLTLSSGSWTFDGATYDPDVKVRNDVTFDVGTASLGDGTWTVGGNWDSFSTGVFSSNNSLLILTGSGKTYGPRAATSAPLNSVLINGYYTQVFTGYTNGRLSIGTGAKLTVNTSVQAATYGNVSDVVVYPGARISGAGILHIRGGSQLTKQDGIVDVTNFWIQAGHSSATSRIQAATYDSSSVYMYTPSVSSTIQFTSGTARFKGDVIIRNEGGSTTYTFDTATNDTNFVFEKNVTIMETSTARVDWIVGDGTLTFSGSNVQGLNLKGKTVNPIVVNKSAGLVALTGTGSGGGSGSTYGLTVTNGTFEQKSKILVNTGSLTVAAGGTYKVGSGTLRLKGNLINNGGMMVSTTGSVVLNGTDQTLSGSNNFYNLSKIVTSAATLTLASTKTQTVSGALTLQGAAGNRLSLRATSANVQAALKLISSGTQTVDNVDVKDSNASLGQQLVCNAFTENCADSGNNTNWFVVPPNVTGRVYTDEGQTLMSGGKTVSFSLNGGAALDSTITDAGGQFSLSGATMTGGSIITLYLDGNTEKGVTVTLGSGSSMTGVNLYQNRLITRSDSGAVALTTSHLSVADNSGDSDIAAVYSIDSGILNVKSGKALIVWSGDTFTPGSAVNVGSGVTIHGAFNPGANAVTLSGSWITKPSGSFASTHLVTFDGTGSTLGRRIIRPNGGAFSGVTIAGGGVYVQSGALTLTSNFIMTAGTFDNATFDNAMAVSGSVMLAAARVDMGDGAWRVEGSFNNAGVASFNANASTLYLSGTGVTLTPAALSTKTFRNVVIDGYASLSTNNAYIDGTATVNAAKRLSIPTGITFAVNTDESDLQIGSNARITGAGTLGIQSGASISVQNGVIDVATLSIVGMHRNSGNRIAAATYDSAAVGIISFGGTITSIFEFSPGTTQFNGDVTVTSFTPRLVVDNSATNADLIFKKKLVLTQAMWIGWIKGTGTLTFNGTTNQDLNLLGRSVEDIVINKSAGSVRMTGTGSTDSITVTAGTFEQRSKALTVSGSITVDSSGIYQQGSGSLSLAGNLLNSGTFRATTGSLILNGTNQTLSGSNYLYNLTKSVSATRTLTLAGTKAQNISGALVLNGALSNRLNIRSTTTNVQSLINLDSEGTQTLSYLNVQDSNASGMRLICETSCFDGGNNTNWGFGKAGTGSLNGTAWVDTDGDGRREAGETSVFSSAAITLSGNTATGANLSLSRSTNALGQYAFSGVVVSNAAGYTIDIDTSGIAANYIRTRATSSGGNIVTTGSVLRVDFGFVLGSSLSGAVFIDSDEDGQKDAGETSVFSGATLSLTGTSNTGGTVNITKLSNTNGIYAFSGLPTSSGGLLLVITPPTGYTTTTTNSRSVLLGTGGQIKLQQFGFKLTTSASSSSSSTSSGTPAAEDSGVATRSGGARSETIRLQIRGATGEDSGVGEAPTPVSPSELAPEELARTRARELARTVRDRRDDRLREVARILKLEDERPAYLSKAEERRQKRLDRLTFLENIEPKPLITLRPMPQSPVRDLIDEVQASLLSKAWDATVNTFQSFSRSAKETVGIAAENLATTAKNATQSAKAIASVTMRGGKNLIARALDLRTEQQKRTALAQKVLKETLAKIVRPALQRGQHTAVLIGLRLTNGLKRVGGLGTATVNGLIAVQESSTSLLALISLRVGHLGASAANSAAQLIARMHDTGLSAWTGAKDAVDVAIVQNIESLLAIRSSVNEKRTEVLATIGSKVRQSAAWSRDGIGSAFDKTVGALDGAIGYTESARHGVVVFLAQVLGVSDRINSVPDAEQVAIVPLEYKTKLRKKGDKEIIAAFHMNVTNIFGDPYRQTPVVMFSTPKVSVTNDQGIVTFHGIEVGKHRIEIHTGDAVETREIVIEPPTDITAIEAKPVDVILPVVQIVVTEPEHGSAPDNSTFPPLALLLVGLLAVGNLYTFYHFVDLMQRRRKRVKR